jgi:hypothetical protein
MNLVQAECKLNYAWQFVTSTLFGQRNKKLSQKHCFITTIFILIVRVQVLTEDSMKMTAFLDIAPCSLGEIHRRFRGAYCLNHQGYYGGRSTLLERRSTSARLYAYVPERCHHQIFIDIAPATQVSVSCYLGLQFGHSCGDRAVTLLRQWKGQGRIKGIVGPRHFPSLGQFGDSKSIVGTTVYSRLSGLMMGRGCTDN